MKSARPALRRLLFLCLLTCLWLAGRTAGQTVVGWGKNDDGQRTVPSGLANAIAVAAGGSHSLALKSDGSVIAWGDNFLGQRTVPVGLANVVAVVAGYSHSLALKADGSVGAWGWNGHGQSTVPVGLADVIAVAAGVYHSLALKADGAVVAWGLNSYGQSTVPAALANVIAVAAGGHHSLALKTDGTVVAWGWNDYGQTTVPAGLSNVIAVAAGGTHSLALKANGTVVAWGWNGHGQTTIPAGLANVIAVAAGAGHALALKAGGAVVAWGDNLYGQRNVPLTLANVITVAAGFGHSLALTRTPPPPIQFFAAAGQPLSIPGPGAKAGCAYRVPGLPSWLTLDPLTGTISGTAPATFAAIALNRALRYRAGYTVEEQVLRILPAWYSSYAAWQAHHFGSTTTPQSQLAADADGDGLPNLLEFLTGSDPYVADSALKLQQNGSAFSLSLDVLPGMETTTTLRAQFSNNLTFTTPAEVTTPTRTETLPNGWRRLVFEDPASTGAARRFARLVASLP